MAPFFRTDHHVCDLQRPREVLHITEYRQAGAASEARTTGRADLLNAGGPRQYLGVTIDVPGNIGPRPIKARVPK